MEIRTNSKSHDNEFMNYIKEFQKNAIFFPAIEYYQMFRLIEI